MIQFIKQQEKQNSKKMAYLYILIAATSDFTANMICKFSSVDSTVLQLQTRFGSCFMFNYILLNANKIREEQLYNKYMPFMILRCFFGPLSGVFFMHAIRLLYVTECTSIMFMNPFFGMFFASIILGDKFTWTDLIAVTLSFSGTLLIIKPPFVADWLNI